jgi:Mn-dependent DtxR family transcriptional regulator
MTTTQKKYLISVKELIEKNEDVTLAKIAKKHNVTISSVQTQIEQLIMLGEIGKMPNRKNGIFLVKNKEDYWKGKYFTLLKENAHLKAQINQANSL